MWKRIRRRGFLLSILIAVCLLVAIAYPTYLSIRRRSVCYVVGEVVNPGRLEIWGRKLTVSGAIREAQGLRLSADRISVRLIRPASFLDRLLTGPIRSSPSPEKSMIIDIGNPATDYRIRSGDRLVVYKNDGN